MSTDTCVALSPERIQAALAEETAGREPFGFWNLTDDGLLSVRKQYLRMIEDNPGRPHAMIDGWLASIRWVRLVRWCLHMRYGAVDEHLGTKSWDRYNRFGEPPAYSLAVDLDRLRWSLRDHPKMPRRGTRRHILNWPSDTPEHPFAVGPVVGVHNKEER